MALLERGEYRYKGIVARQLYTQTCLNNGHTETTIAIDGGAEIDVTRNDAGKTALHRGISGRLHWDRPGPHGEGLTTGIHKVKTYKTAGGSSSSSFRAGTRTAGV
jgi:hypothetical protein